MPSLHRGLRHGREYAGFCAPTIKAIFLAQSSYDCEAKEYIDAGEENPKHVVFHEVGHFIDMFVTGTGRYPEGYRSKKDDFSSAFKRDIGKTGKDVPSFLISQLADDPEYASYYWNFIRNKFMDGENSSEAYAELWAELNNSCTEDLPPINPLFPECRKIVAADIAALENPKF